MTIEINSRRVETNDRFNGIRLGDRVRDILTGFSGVVTAQVSYLTGCDQCLILPRSESQSKINEALWFDIERIELLEKNCVSVKSAPSGRDLNLPAKR